MAYAVAHHFAGHLHGNGLVAGDGVGEDSHYDAFELAHGAVGLLGDDVYDLGRDAESVAFGLEVEYGLAERQVGLRELFHDSPFETVYEAVGHSVELHRRTVAGEHQLLAALVEVVEDGEEGVERTGLV